MPVKSSDVQTFPQARQFAFMNDVCALQGLMSDMSN